MFAMAGLDMELGNTTSLNLGRAEVARALRYVPSELNGFPRWFEPLYRRYPKQSKQFLLKELIWELEQAPTEQPIHYLLHDVVYHAPWVHADIAPDIRDWLVTNDVAHTATLNYCRAILISGELPTSEIANLAAIKHSSKFTPTEQLPIWEALLVDADPGLWLGRLGPAMEAQASKGFVEAGVNFFAALMGGRGEGHPTIGQFKTPTYLAELYLLAHKVIRVSEDVDRANAGVYSPNARDDAQDARERLLGLLGQVHGALANNELRRLALSHPVIGYRDYIRTQAYRHAVEDGDLTNWTVGQIISLSRRLAQLPGADQVPGVRL
jgi:hypothetical protein